MTSKERVEAALAGDKTDRVPLFLWLSERAENNFKKYLAANPGIYAPENDVLQDWLSINRQMTLPAAEGEIFTDEWGIDWKREGEYNNVVSHPLAEADAEVIENYVFPQPLLPKRYEKLRRLMSENPDSFIGADVSGTLFEPSYHIRGMENLLVDLASESEEAEVLLDKIIGFSCAVCAEAAKLGADWIWLGDDFGTQQAMILSPALWRRYFKPRYAALIEEVKKIRKDMPFAFHSCGSVFPIIGDLKEIGVNVINPLQESAAGMEHEKIRAQYPDVTMFCGVDTQTLLRSGTPGAVYKKTLEKIDALGRNGRYILGCSHTIQSDVPCENIAAVYAALKDAR